MKLFFIITLVIIIILIILIIYKFNLNVKNKSLENLYDLDNMNKKIIIFSSGPSLNKIEKYLHIFTKEFYNNYCIIAVKSSAIYLDKLGIKVDYFVYNFYNYKPEYSNYNFVNSPNIKRILSINVFNINYLFFMFNHGRYKYDYNIFLHNNIELTSFNCVNQDKYKCFDIINNKARNGHIIVENALYLAILLKSQYIYILGWDVCNNKKNIYFKEHYKNTNIVKNWKEFEDFEYTLTFSKYLPEYLKKHYNVNIYKLSDKQCVHLPLYDINKL